MILQDVEVDRRQHRAQHHDQHERGDQQAEEPGERIAPGARAPARPRADSESTRARRRRPEPTSGTTARPARPSPDEPGIEPSEPADDQRDHAEDRRAEAVSRARSARRAADRLAKPEAAEDQCRRGRSPPRRSGRRPADREPLRAGSRRGSAPRGPCPATTRGTTCPGTTSGNALSNSKPRRIGPPRFVDVRQGDDQEPGEPGQLEAARATARTVRAREAAGVGRSPARPCVAAGCRLRGSARSSKARTPPRRRRAARSWSSAAGHVEDQLEEPAADALDRLAFQDRAGVEVHVVDHLLVHRRVGRHLDARASA